MIKKRVHEQWAYLRLSVIGQLLAAPPEKGALRAELAALSAREWRHPTTGEPVHFGASTIERWYYRALKLAFTRTDQRTQRKSDGTIVIEGHRFEVPNRYRHIARLEVRFASWDLSLVHLADDRTGNILCRLFPQDKTKNASGLRRSLDKVSDAPTDVLPARWMAPLLAKLIERQAVTQLAPPYLPKDEGCDR